MRTIIAGSRDIPLIGFDFVMSQYCPSCITEVVSGAARGIDTFGEIWANEHGVPIKRMPADWSRWGRAAGFYRNVDMAEYAEQAIIIWDGESKGTLHMIDTMRKLGKDYYLDYVRGMA